MPGVRYWPNSTKNNYLYGNRQLGAIRLRQLRVLPTDCPYIQQKFFAQARLLPAHTHTPPPPRTHTHAPR